MLAGYAIKLLLTVVLSRDTLKWTCRIFLVFSHLKTKCVYFISLLSKKVKFKICRTIILPVFLYGCETWSLTLREERRLRVFENRVLRRVFGPKRDKVRGEWRKLHN